ncbi:flagellar biosynthetic protein FliO [Clostridium formicaceticum]|uniref:Flagellar protein n=1 Tax=Clostridium formicaceticum TaxID=1497 RepID=A0AAC9RLG2_9CLOT|nr:flagellar biosynthetic protein FliO [Clostridium formicaceticum]AOY77306.1 hypothetical protein BJL90_16495 [Clostridium formicaceticum]ARE87849.1 hypothetical protein CLFO_22490 [Clostridium formicaceticum]
MINTIYTFFMMVIIAVCVIFLAYYTTRVIGKKSNLYFQGRTAKVLERTTLAPNLNLMVIQVMDKVYILVVCNKNMEILDTLSIEAWNIFKKTQGDALQNNKDFLKISHNIWREMKEKLAVMMKKINKKSDRK